MQTFSCVRKIPAAMVERVLRGTISFHCVGMDISSDHFIYTRDRVCWHLLRLHQMLTRKMVSIFTDISVGNKIHNVEISASESLNLLTA